MNSCIERKSLLAKRAESLFRDYCLLHEKLDCLKDENLSSHILESFLNHEKILRKQISSLSRVMSSYENDMLNAGYNSSFFESDSSDDTLVHWKKMAYQHNIKSRARIGRLMVSLKREINGLSVPRRKSIYAGKSVAGLIDIRQ